MVLIDVLTKPDDVSILLVQLMQHATVALMRVEMGFGPPPNPYLGPKWPRKVKQWMEEYSVHNDAAEDTHKVRDLEAKQSKDRVQ